jgi:hypothetical protein
MKNIISKITILAILTCNTNVDIFCQASDDLAKAVAFEKLAMFISWPASDTIKDSSGIFIIAVLKNKPFGKNLEDVYKTHQIKNKNVQIVYLDNIQELKKCDLLYISNSSTNELKTILSSIYGKPILTIADKEGFAEAGCFINLYEFENKMRFEINQKSLQDAGFTVDYRLLRVSKVLNPVIE